MLHMITSEQTFVNGPCRKFSLAAASESNRFDPISNLYTYTVIQSDADSITLRIIAVIMLSCFGVAVRQSAKALCAGSYLWTPAAISC